MADLTQTAANVGVNAASGALSILQAGEALTQGQPFYLKASDSKHWRCDADAQESATALGIVLTPCGADEYFVAALNGTTVDLGATLAVGVQYYVSPNSGKICLESDVLSGDYPTSLGIATAADKLPLDIKASGVVKA